MASSGRLIVLAVGEPPATMTMTECGWRTLPN